MLRFSLFLAFSFFLNLSIFGQQVSLNVDSTSKRHAEFLQQQLGLNITQYQALLKLEHKKLIIIDSIQKNGAKIPVDKRKALVEDMNSEYDSELKVILTQEQYKMYDAHLKIQKQRALAERDKLKSSIKPL